jgi:hypothetical protein
MAIADNFAGIWFFRRKAWGRAVAHPKINGQSLKTFLQLGRSFVLWLTSGLAFHGPSRFLE